MRAAIGAGRRNTTAALLVAGLLFACSVKAAPTKTDVLTPAQRTQVVEIVRDALKKDPSILREAIVALQADNERIEEAATRMAIARRHDAIFQPDDPSIGDTGSGVVIAEFFDPACPYCRKLAPQMTRFVAKYRDVRLVYKDFPILGPASELGSRALLAAQRQRGYERLRAAIMSDPRDITTESIREDAQKVGLDWPRLQHDMQDPIIARKIAQNISLAHALGIDGTPSFVIGGKIVSEADMTLIADAVAATRRGDLPRESRSKAAQ